MNIWLWVILPFYHPCVTVIHFILKLWTVLNYHGIGEQTPVILCPKQKNWRCPTSFFITPHSKTSFWQLWVIIPFYPPCVTVIHFILKLWTVLNYHGIGEQTPVILCPKQKNWRCPTSFFITPHSKTSFWQLWVIIPFYPPCVTVIHFILKLWTVFNSHGIGEQALVILCPEKKNRRCQTELFITPHSKINVICNYLVL